MRYTQFRIKLPGGDYLRGAHGEPNIYTMGGDPDDRIGVLEREVGGTAVEIMTRLDIARQPPPPPREPIFPPISSGKGKAP